ncbi:MAG: metallophosphoesterase [Prolixibacteraceae bacterium]|nr:metallophosphoesterase [Prolixibacteraceae bacterium]MBN2775590.1 metallophosphoesterase [Prolixibacteraceae bacterium]
MYDIIGDVHGYASLLKKLLKRLGYKKKNTVYSHSTNKAIFVGDFINRGPEVRETLILIRNMVEAGNAIAILGNHELNVLLAHLKDQNGLSLVQKNDPGYFKTRKAFSYYPEEWKSHRRWMRTLPLFFENGQFRVIHACWIDENVKILKEVIPDGKIRKSLLRDIYYNPDSPVGRSVWQSTKGIYFEMPADLSLRNNKKRYIRSYRMKWWESTENKTFNEISFESKMELPGYTIPPEILPRINFYPESSPIVFFGHYCRGNGPFIVKNNICCVDSCVTNTKTLAAYTWQGEDKLKESNLFMYSKQ